MRKGKPISITEGKLRELYQLEKLSQAEIAQRLHCDESAIRRKMKAYGINVRTPSEAARLSRGIEIPEEALREFYENQGLSLAEIAEKFDCSETAVRNRMVEYGIEARLPWEKAAVDISEGELRELYEEKGLSEEEIAQMHNCSISTISRKMQKFGIEARPPGKLKYPRHDFGGDLLEKAYLIGFRLGDLTVRRAELSIEVLMTTTHLAQIQLFHELFSPYGHVYEHRRKDGKAFMSCRLNETFEFLLPKEDRIEEWVLADDEAFFAFLAGYVDAEGSFQVDRRGQAKLDLQTCDKGILHQIQTRLVQLGIGCPIPKLVVRAGRVNPQGIVQNKDTWFVGIRRRKSLHKLLKRFGDYLRHGKRKADAERVKGNIEWKLKGEARMLRPH